VLLHLAGLSTRVSAHVSRGVLGLSVSPAEVSNALKTIVSAAKAFLERPLGGRRFKYLWVDGTFFRVRRTAVAREPTLVVIGVDETDRKSVLAMVQGDKDARSAWQLVFAMLNERGPDPSAVELGVMDGLPGLGEAFLEVTCPPAARRLNRPRRKRAPRAGRQRRSASWARGDRGADERGDEVRDVVSNVDAGDAALRRRKGIAGRLAREGVGVGLELDLGPGNGEL
jgi:hypothetical protein